MKVDFHPQAAIELEDAVIYYEQIRPGLGLEFAREVYASILRMREYPEAGTPRFFRGW